MGVGVEMLARWLRKRSSGWDVAVNVTAESR